MRFSAVILAGGQSSRMGQDKAMLDVNGQVLLARQIELIRLLNPAEILISGRQGVDYSNFDAQVLYDHFDDAGPLAGIESALESASCPLVLVLAVDMGRMQVTTLRRLMDKCAGSVGVVPLLEGEPEPLAAFYPRRARSLAAKLLSEGKHVMKDFVKECENRGLIKEVDVFVDEASCFANWNTPQDIQPEEYVVC